MKIVLLNVEQAQSIYRSQMVRDFPESELKPFASVQGMMTRGLYEPIHGSAPDIAGKNVANPIATILSCAMMLRDSFDLLDEAECIENAVAEVLNSGYRTADIMSDGGKLLGTREMGEKIVETLKK